MRTIVYVAHVLITLAAMLAGAKTAVAGAISTPSLNAIYGQSSFGSTPISVNWLSPGTTIVSPGLASIDNGTELNQLFALRQDPSDFSNPGFRIVNVFFVDSLNFCGVASSSVVGCANTPGNLLVVESGVAAGSLGTVLLAHELAHSLGLEHVNTVGNLMNPALSASATNVTGGQVATILQNNGGILQTAPNGSRFVQLRPISVLSAAVVAVPEPETWVLTIFGLLVIAFAVRRQSIAGRPVGSLRGAV